MKNLLILKSGNAHPQVAQRHGDYDAWFIRTLQRGGDALRFDVVPAFRQEALPETSGYDAVLMTGSPSSVTEQAPWMLRAGELMVNAAERGIPVLGVCFGHQLLGQVLGGEVRRNPKGRELGTIRCQLTASGQEDPLFDGLPPHFEVQATHEDFVFRPPPGAELLATNDHTPVQAFRAGRLLRGVQFHPEMDDGAMRTLLETKTEVMDPERLRALHEGLRPTPLGARILLNFLRHFT